MAHPAPDAPREHGRAAIVLASIATVVVALAGVGALLAYALGATSG